MSRAWWYSIDSTYNDMHSISYLHTRWCFSYHLKHSACLTISIYLRVNIETRRPCMRRAITCWRSNHIDVGIAVSLNNLCSCLHHRLLHIESWPGGIISVRLLLKFAEIISYARHHDITWAAGYVATPAILTNEGSLANQNYHSARNT